jgi:predicted DNA-binding transcriptional regulator AlpA
MRSSDWSPASHRSAAAPSANVTLSPYVNERFPAWEELLSARDVARLMRRPRWMLPGLMLLRRFPSQRRFRGRAVGWLRGEVLDWLAKDLRVPSCSDRAMSMRRLASAVSRPRECRVSCTVRQQRGPCSDRSSRSL